MLPGVYNFLLYRGDTNRVRFVLWSDEAKTIALDLTGASVAAQIRDRPDSAEVVVTLTCTITLPNTIEVSIPAAQAATLKPKGAWDLQLIWPDGDVQTVLAGSANTTPDVTRI